MGCSFVILPISLVRIYGSEQHFSAEFFKTSSVHRFSARGRDPDQIFTKQAVVNPTNTFYSVKRFIGRKMNEVEDESKQVSYKVMRDPNGNVKLECPVINKQFAAEEISAQVRSIKLPLS